MFLFWEKKPFGGRGMGDGERGFVDKLGSGVKSGCEIEANT